MLSKIELRVAARARRKSLAGPGFAAALARHAEVLNVPVGTIIGGYHALQDEADPSLLLAALAKQGCAIAFPRVAARDAALEFHRVPDGEVLQPGAFGVHEPLAHWPHVVPDLLLVPLLAFDAEGHRLGYGGGFYDRTLAAWPSVRAIGIAYAGQRVAFIPRDAHDRTLAAILTEQGLQQVR
jgi:5-formyltetrahydrofolate cyclo-ligase